MERSISPAAEPDPLGAVVNRSTVKLVVGAPLLLVALMATIVAWVAHPPPRLSALDAVVLLVLIATVGASRLWSVRVGRATRLYISSIPLYLLCCLFSPALAATAIGVGMLAREITICRQCANTTGTIAAQVGRWMLLGLGVSAVVSLWPAEYVGYAALLALALLWVGDVLTCPFVFTPITGKDPLVTLITAARQSFTGELMQYLIAMSVLLMFRTGILWSGVLWVDVMGILLVVLPVLLLYCYLKGEDALQGESSGESLLATGKK